MSYEVLARKWRPRSFNDMVGQGHVLKTLVNALDTGRLHHAYLFTGTRGVGKTTLARILAKCLNCEQGVSSSPCGECSACTSIDEGRFVDLIEVDAASRAKVEETRDLMDNVQYAPGSGRYKVYLIDEVHMFSNHSFNALLKTLEEPPPHVKFLLATTEAKKIPVTILSRCLQFNLKHLTSEQIEQQLVKILQSESIQFDDAAASLVATAARGSMRDALSILDQAISYGNGDLREQQVSDMLGTLNHEQLFGLLDDIIAANPESLLGKVRKMAETTPDYDAVLGDFLGLLHDIAVAQVMPQGSDTVDAKIASYAGSMQAEDIQLYYQIAVNGRRDLYMAPDPQTGFEMTMIRLLAFRPADGSGEQGASAGTASGKGSTAETQMAGGVQSKTRAPATAGSDDWQRLIDEMALAGLVKELAGHCSLKEHNDSVVHLVLQPSQEHLLKTTQKSRLQEAIKMRFGERVKLVITVEDSSRETPNQKKEREAREAKAAALDSIEKDPNVQSILDTFNATIDKDATSIQSGEQGA